MDFDSYITMGGYALHVWGSYGLALLVYGGMMIHAVIRYDRMKSGKKP